MSSTLAADIVVGRHREETPGLVHVSSFGIRRRPAVLAWFRKGRHRLPEYANSNGAPAPAVRPAI